MKMLFITYNEAVDEEVMEIVDAVPIEGYTKWTKVLGKGTTSGPHLSTHVWPKANNVLMIGAEDGQAEKLIERMRELRAKVGHEGVKAFLMPLETLT